MSYYNIERMERVPRTFKDRLRIKQFKNPVAMYDFLHGISNDTNEWKLSLRDWKAGLYAYAGGEWHNVKSLDASVLAHI